MQSAYTADCVTHAAALAALLIDEGRAPWIARLREVAADFWAPLSPLRFPATTWNTHYVCCADGLAFDPILGVPHPLDGYAAAVFGRAIPLVEHFPPAVTAELVRRGELRKAFHPNYRM